MARFASDGGVGTGFSRNWLSRAPVADRGADFLDLRNPAPVLLPSAVYLTTKAGGGVLRVLGSERRR